MKNKDQLKVVKDKEEWINRTTDEFEQDTNMKELKAQVKDENNVDINNVDGMEKMLGDLREAALVINHENRKKQGGSAKKNFRSDRDISKKDGSGVPKSLRMVDMESERYQEEKQKKIQSSLAPQEELVESRSCMRCTIF